MDLINPPIIIYENLMNYFDRAAKILQPYRIISDNLLLRDVQHPCHFYLGN